MSIFYHAMSISYHIPDPTKISISRLKKRWYGQSPRFGLGAPMKWTPVFFAYGILVACGGSTPTSPPTQGTAYFAMDGVSCTYAGTKAITFYIAAAEVGTESLLGGATSTGYLTKPSAGYTRAGNPVVQARIANYTPTGGALWTQRTSIKVPAGGSVTHTFTC